MNTVGRWRGLARTGAALLLGASSLGPAFGAPSLGLADQDHRTPEQRAVALALAPVIRVAWLPVAVEHLLVASHPSGRLAAVSDGPARWGWPLAGHPAVIGPYDPPPEPWLPGHRGVDLAGTAGEPVRAVADGVVSYSGQIDGVGVVSVLHRGGVRSTYQPMADRVARGTRVGAGEPLGTLEPAGHCLLRGCLHLGARRGETYLDPMLFLTAWEVSLLPRSW